MCAVSVTAAQPHALAVAQRAVDLERRIGELVAPGEIALAAALQQPGIRGGGKHLRAGRGLDRGDAAGMVEMGLAVEQDLDLARVEAERADVGEHLRRELRHPRVDQDQAVAAVDQHRRDVARADVIDSVGDAERVDPLCPPGGMAATPRRGRSAAGEQKREHGRRRDRFGIRNPDHLHPP
jgi:hypothetical protein